MYHQFLSYHMGTNRSIFLLLPRPHIVQTENTFVNGPRELEGIQEVFLTVLKPRTIERMCVEAYLETAHIAKEAALEQRVVDRTNTLTVIDDQRVSLISKAVGRSYSAGKSGTFQASDGFAIYEARIDPTPPLGTGEIDSTDYRIVSQDANQVTAWCRTYAEITQVTRQEEDPKGHPKVTTTYERVPGHIELSVLIRQRKTELVPVGPVTTNLWLTGRGVCACENASSEKPTLREGVTWEGLLRTEVETPTDDGAEMTIRDANQMSADIGRQLVQTINDPDRYPAGAVRFSDTELLARTVGGCLVGDGHPDDVPVQAIDGINEAVARRAAETVPGLTRAGLLRMSLQEQADRFDLSVEEATKLRRAALGLAAPVREPDARWPDRRGDDRTVPDLSRLPLDVAADALGEQNLRLGPISYEDSELQADYVLGQSPESGTTVPAGTAVGLVLATGVFVLVPDIVGEPLSRALMLVAQAGLRTEPTLVFEPPGDRPRQHVVGVQPEERASVSPTTPITLFVTDRD
jgi:hypothetical protein